MRRASHRNFRLLGHEFSAKNLDSNSCLQQVGTLAKPKSLTDASSDEELVDAAQRGDRSALESLLNRHYLKIFSLCRRMLGSEEDACDAAQEAVLSIVRNLPKFSQQAAFSTWAYRIAANACLDEIAKRKRRPLVTLGGEQGGSEAMDPISSAADPADTAETAAARLDIQAALAALREEFRVAVVLRDQGELSYEEIAKLLDVPIGTVRSRIARGRAELAERLKEKPQQKQASGEPNQKQRSLNEERAESPSAPKATPGKASLSQTEKAIDRSPK